MEVEEHTARFALYFQHPSLDGDFLAHVLRSFFPRDGVLTFFGVFSLLAEAARGECEAEKEIQEAHDYPLFMREGWELTVPSNSIRYSPARGFSRKFPGDCLPLPGTLSQRGDRVLARERSSTTGADDRSIRVVATALVRSRAGGRRFLRL